MASKYGYERFLRPINSRMYSCCGCFRPLLEEDWYVDCADCGAIFCESCVRNGTMDKHSCEEDEFDFEEVD